MGKFIEVNHVSLGGEVGTVGWAMPYLDEDHARYAIETLNAADALVLGRKTYEGLSDAYLAMPPSDFVDRMNSIRKYVATRTMRTLHWNAVPIDGDVMDFVADLKQHTTGTLLKYGNGPLDAELMDRGLIDEFHLLLTPVAAGGGVHLFESVRGAPALRLMRLERFVSGVVLLVYAPLPASSSG
jgi:dihydrofolate reductase